MSNTQFSRLFPDTGRTRSDNSHLTYEARVCSRSHALQILVARLESKHLDSGNKVVYGDGVCKQDGIELFGEKAY